VAKKIDGGVPGCIVGEHDKVAVAFTTLGGDRAHDVGMDKFKRPGLREFVDLLGERSPSHVAENACRTDAI
jgi:hypothetical protein